MRTLRYTETLVCILPTLVQDSADKECGRRGAALNPTCLHKRRERRGKSALACVPRALIRRYIAVIITARESAIVDTYTWDACGSR